MSRAPETARRKPPGQRRAEIVRTAGTVAVREGLDRVTAKRVADELGVVPGLINHYFANVDDLVAEAFRHGAAGESAELFGKAGTLESPVERIQALVGEWLHADRDAISLLWLDAWQASRRRPALRQEVERQMAADLEALSALVAEGVRSGHFHTTAPRDAAMQIFSLIDGFSVQAATRSNLDYRVVRTLVVDTTERILGLLPRTLRIREWGPRMTPEMTRGPLPVPEESL